MLPNADALTRKLDPQQAVNLRSALIELEMGSGFKWLRSILESRLEQLEVKRMSEIMPSDTDPFGLRALVTENCMRKEATVLRDVLGLVSSTRTALDALLEDQG